jgi:hypothetical protein
MILFLFVFRFFGLVVIANKPLPSTLLLPSLLSLITAFTVVTTIFVIVVAPSVIDDGDVAFSLSMDPGGNDTDADDEDENDSSLTKISGSLRSVAKNTYNRSVHFHQ